MEVSCRGVCLIGNVEEVVRLRLTIVWKARYVADLDAIIVASQSKTQMLRWMRGKGVVFDTFEALRLKLSAIKTSDFNHHHQKHTFITYTSILKMRLRR